ANALAVDVVRDWKTWANGRLILSGPAGSGKTHLLSIWAADVGAERVRPEAVSSWRPKSPAVPLAIEDLSQTADQHALVLLLNQMAADGLPVLLSSNPPPKDLGFALPDLVSRIESSSHVTLGAVDDALLNAVFLKLASDRQLTFDPGVVPFTLARVERSLSSLKNLVAKLDHMSLQRQKPVTKRLVGDAIATLEDGGTDERH
ncbi:MAG: chromosomal replication initiator DnaA, partial [Pseudomonadota bacterium]